MGSQKQVHFGYGVKNRRIGAAAIINPHHQPKKRTQNKATKSTKTAKRGLEPAYLASYCGKQYTINSTDVQQYMWYRVKMCNTY